MIFIVKDEHNELRDRTIAKQFVLLFGKLYREDEPEFVLVLFSVMNIHMNRATETQAIGEIDIDKMKRYITYCKT